MWRTLTVRFFLFFFFQAEDGIRDKLVTGVQTCALPISGRSCRLANAVKPATPARNTSLATSPVADTGRSAQRSTPGSVAGSQGPQDGAPCGNPRAPGSTYSTPAVATDAASPHVTRYGAAGACPTIGRGARTRPSTANSPRCTREIPPNSL